MNQIPVNGGVFYGRPGEHSGANVVLGVSVGREAYSVILRSDAAALVTAAFKFGLRVRIWRAN